MTGPKPNACIIGECASSFSYREECALVASGCCARDMLASAKRYPDGARFPMDLVPGGNPFANALKRKGFVRIYHNVTTPTPTPARLQEQEA